jgi:DNA-binding PadR family transcriptional regulator
VLKLPLPPALYLILAVLAEGPAHGYRLRAEIIARSAGALRLDPGSLYRLIARLLDDGLIAEATDRQAPAGPPRRLYRLTTEGRKVLSAETTRLADLVTGVQAALSRGRIRHT